MIASEEAHLVSEVCVICAFLPDETERASGWLDCMLCSDDKPGSASSSTFCKPFLAKHAGGGTHLSAQLSEEQTQKDDSNKTRKHRQKHG